MTLHTATLPTALREDSTESHRPVIRKTEPLSETLDRLFTAIGIEVEDVRVVRPINLPVVQAVLRQFDRHAGEPAAPASAEMVEERWIYDAARWTLTAPNGSSVQLSLSESQMVRCLFARGGEVKSREELLAVLNRPQLEVCLRNLDVTVSRLRRKVLIHCRQRLPVVSARGRGYLFNAPAVVVVD